MTSSLALNHVSCLISLLLMQNVYVLCQPKLKMLGPMADGCNLDRIVLRPWITSDINFLTAYSPSLASLS